MPKRALKISRRKTLQQRKNTWSSPKVKRSLACLKISKEAVMIAANMGNTGRWGVRGKPVQEEAFNVIISVMGKLYGTSSVCLCVCMYTQRLILNPTVDEIYTIFNTMKSESVSHSVVSNSLHPHGLYPARFLCPWNSLRKNTGVGNYSLLQGIPWLRDRPQVSLIAGRFFTI